MTCPWGEPVALPDFCEQIRDCGWVLQPIATASAAAFVPAALWSAHVASTRRAPALHLVTVSCIAMAVGTAAQHVTGTWSAMMLDHGGMQAANVAMLLIGMRRWLGWGWRSMLLAGAAGWGLALALTAAVDDLRRAWVIVGMLPCAAIELRLWFRDGARTTYRAWLVGWIAFAAAIAAWGLDHDPSWCDPGSWMQLHAIWHAFSAAAMAAWATYYGQFAALQRG